MGQALESTSEPTSVPSASPSALPSLGPSPVPSLSPSLQPTVQPSYLPSDAPSGVPSTEPSSYPSSSPSKLPSTSPSTFPSLSPSVEPSSQSSVSLKPSSSPSHQPSLEPSTEPTLSLAPSAAPSISSQPSSTPTALDSDKDGVPNSIDECPSKGGHVDQRGCPIDTDDDGIADCISDLHHTLSGCDFDPQSDTFNSTCCNIEWDRCFSDTPPGANSTSTLRAYVQNSTYVNSLGQTIEPGCTSDEDEDDVVDGIDQCLNTTTVEKELAAKADGKMTFFTSGASAGCAILSESMWNPIFVTATYNSSNILSDPHVDLIWAVDAALLDIQTSRVGGSFAVDDLAKVSILDGQSCTRKYEGTTRLDDELFEITTSVKNSTDSIFEGQIPEGSRAFRTGIDFNRPVLTQSPLWTLDYTVTEIYFCAKLELVSEDGETKSAEDVPVKIRIDTQHGAMLENTKVSEVERQKESMVAKSLDVHYSLMACQCDKHSKCIDNDPTSANFEGQMLHQGDEVKICIQFDESDLPPKFVRFADVKTLKCSQDSLIYMPIRDYQYTIGSGLTSIRIDDDDRKVIVTTIPPSTFFSVEPSIMYCSGELLYSVYSHDNVFGRLLTGTESRLPNSQSQEASFNINIGLAGNRSKATSHNQFGKNALFASMVIAATFLMLGVARPGSYSWLHRRMFPEKDDACAPKPVEGGIIIGSKIYVPKTSETEPCFSLSESFPTLPTATTSSARLAVPEYVGRRSMQDLRSLTSIQQDFDDSPSVAKYRHSAGEGARAA